MFSVELEHPVTVSQTGGFFLHELFAAAAGGHEVGVGTQEGLPRSHLHLGHPHPRTVHPAQLRHVIMFYLHKHNPLCC